MPVEPTTCKALLMLSVFTFFTLVWLKNFFWKSKKLVFNASVNEWIRTILKMKTPPQVFILLKFVDMVFLNVYSCLKVLIACLWSYLYVKMSFLPRVLSDNFAYEHIFHSCTQTMNQFTSTAVICFGKSTHGLNVASYSRTNFLHW